MNLTIKSLAHVRPGIDPDLDKLVALAEGGDNSQKAQERLTVLAHKLGLCEGGHFNAVTRIQQIVTARHSSAITRTWEEV